MATTKIELAPSAQFASELHFDECNSVVYRIMKPDDVEATMRCVSEAFKNGEPLSHAFGCTLDDWEKFSMMWLPRMAKEGNTVIAVDSETDEVLGAFLNEDFKNPDPEEVESFLENCEGQWGPVLEIIEEVEGKFIEKYKIPAEPSERKGGENFHMWMIGVSAKSRGRGVGRHLFLQSCALAKARGFKVAFAECTGSISTHLFQRYLGAQTEFFVDYATWEGEHSEAVKKIPENSRHRGVSFMTIDLESWGPSMYNDS